MRGVDAQLPPVPRRPDDVLRNQRRRRLRNNAVLARSEAPARSPHRLLADEVLDESRRT